MSRAILVVLLSLLLGQPAVAQRKHRAPPAKGHHKDKDKHRGPKKHRAPPAPEPDMPVRQPQEVHGFKPNDGSPGTLVEIHGGHFDDTTRVRFNGRWLRVVEQGPEVLKVRIPRNAVTDRFVVHKAGFPDVTADNEFVVIRNPVVTGFAPRNGGAGTQVTVTGQHFVRDDRFVIGAEELPTVSFRHDRAVVQLTDAARTGRIGVKRAGRVLAWSRHPFEVFAPPPVIDGFSPPRGERGTVVRITGRNFEPTDFVELEGRRLRIRNRGATFFEVMIGRNATGRFMVRGRRGRQALSSGTFIVIRPPRITGFAPAFGPPGTRITVEGEGFLDGDEVYVGGGMLTMRRVTDRRIVAEIPAGVASGPVFVQRGGRKFMARGRFEVILPPAITDISPRSAPPGATIQIKGRNFTPDISVLLAGRKLRIVGRRLPDEVAVQIPPHARTGEIMVVTRAGSARSPVPFTISPYAELGSVFPLHGLPGTRVTLRGQHFHPGLKVWLGDLQLPVTRLTGTVVEVSIPKGARSGRFAIESHGRRFPSRLAFAVDQPRPELEFTFAPTAGRRGSEVTLFLSPPTQVVMVYFDGRPLPKKVLEAGRRLVITVPSDARSGYFEIEHRGQRYRAKQIFRVTR